MCVCVCVCVCACVRACVRAFFVFFNNIFLCVCVLLNNSVPISHPRSRVGFLNQDTSVFSLRSCDLEATAKNNKTGMGQKTETNRGYPHTEF